MIDKLDAAVAQIVNLKNEVKLLKARVEILSRKPLEIGLDNEGWRDGEHCVCNFDPHSPKVRKVCQFHESIYKEWAQAKAALEEIRALLLQNGSSNLSWRVGQEHTYLGRIDLLAQKTLGQTS
jgi:hypothetical protein